MHGHYQSDGGAVLRVGSWCLAVEYVVGPWGTWKAYSLVLGLHTFQMYLYRVHIYSAT